MYIYLFSFWKHVVDVFKTLDWREKGINLNGEYLSNLRFAAGIELFSDNLQQLQQLVTELNKAMVRFGPKINISRSKIMTNQGLTPDMKLANEIL